MMTIVKVHLVECQDVAERRRSCERCRGSPVRVSRVCSELAEELTHFRTTMTTNLLTASQTKKLFILWTVHVVHNTSLGRK